MLRKLPDRDAAHESGNPSVHFELDAFAWSAPDELEVAGRFIGLIPAIEETPALVVRGGGVTHRLAPVPGGELWPPADGEPWRTAFGWDEPPTPVDGAELQIGGLVLGLPEPGSVSPAAPAILTGVEQPPTQRADIEAAVERGEQLAAAEGVDGLREHAGLVLAREELREARAAHAAALEDLAHVTGQLDDARRAREADGERFRDGIDSLRARAEETIADGHEELAAVRHELDRSEAESKRLQEERDAAVARLPPLESAARDLEDLRARIESMTQRDANLRAELSAAHDEAEDLRSVCARVSERLETIRVITEGA